MALVRINIFRISGSIFQHYSIHSAASPLSLEDSIKNAVGNKSYQEIPTILASSKERRLNPNPFSFLSTFPFASRIQVVDDILQSFILLRPHSKQKIAYDYLLLYTLQSSNPFPLSLAILQRTLRSGCSPVPQIVYLLSSAWLDCRSQSQPVANLLLEMKSIGYRPDCGTCNYIISSLCAIDRVEEAVQVLNGMVEAACVPDLDSYSPIVAAMCTLRKTTDAVAIMKQMVKKRLSPRQEIVRKLAAALRANKEIWRAIEMIEFLNKKGLHITFEIYELVVEGCLECGEFILAGKVVMVMTEKGFIPYIEVRQKVVEGLTSVGEWELACSVRHRFAELNS